jgi:hypothetical protein
MEEEVGERGEKKWRLRGGKPVALSAVRQGQSTKWHI